MGALQSGSIPSLFQGISQQPPTIRFRGQVEDALNMAFSVETGGTSKRPGTLLLGSAGDALDPTGEDEASLQVIKTSDQSSYALIHEKGRLRVFSMKAPDGNFVFEELDIEFDDPEDEDLQHRDPGDLVFLSALDTTFVVDRTQPIEMEDPIEKPAPGPSPEGLISFADPPPPGMDGWAFGTAQLTNSGVAATFGIRLKTSNNTIHTMTQSVGVEDGTSDILEKLLTEGWDSTGDGEPPESFRIGMDGSFLYFVNTNGEDFVLEPIDPFGDTAWRIATNRVRQISDLPARSLNGHRVEVRAETEEEGYWLEFKPSDNVAAGTGSWNETVPYGVSTAFKPGSMPKRLIPVSDGQGGRKFRLERIDWDEKTAGGEELVPPPEFVGQKISDIVFFANRLGLVAGETAFFSGSGDFFRFWPNSAVTFDDDDPFGLTNTSAQGSQFVFGTTFRRSLYITADNSQFEVFGQPFTPSTAAIEIATRYPTDNQVRPVAVGDEMYFLSGFNNRVALYAYTYTEDTASETALEVSKHVDQLITGSVRAMSANPLTNEIFVLTDDDPSLVYVHRWYYEGRERAQSSWTKYHLQDRQIKDVAYVSGSIVFLSSRPVPDPSEPSGEKHVMDLELYRTRDSGDENFSIIPHLDRNWVGQIDASYDPENDLTTFTDSTGYRLHVPDMTAVYPEDGPDPALRGVEVPLHKESEGAWVAEGDWTQTNLMFGQPFYSMLELSPIYLRNQADEPIISGRLQLRRVKLWYDNTQCFRVRVKPVGRPDRVYAFEHDLSRLCTETQSGVFSFMVGSRADETRIIIESDSFRPMTFTSLAWTGFYNETSRQG